MGTPLQMLRTGIDIIEIERVGLVFSRYGDRFLKRIFTQEEQDYCRGRPQQLAARFAAKEAVMKLLGTGVKGVSWRDIEVTRCPGSPPQIQLYGSAKARSLYLGISHIAISLSHSNAYAVASVVADSRNNNQQH